MRAAICRRHSMASHSRHERHDFAMIAPQVAWPVALQDAIYIGGRAAGWQRKLLLLQISVENFAKNGGRCRVGVISDRLEISIRSSLGSEKNGRGTVQSRVSLPSRSNGFESDFLGGTFSGKSRAASARRFKAERSCVEGRDERSACHSGSPKAESRPPSICRRDRCEIETSGLLPAAVAVA
jgi:hypothetical protein